MSVWSMCPPDSSMGIGCDRRIVKLTEHWSAKHSHHEPVYHILDSSSLISSEVERMLRRKRKLHFTYECSPYQGTCAYETISLIIDSDTVVQDVWGEVSRDMRRILRGY